MQFFTRRSLLTFDLNAGADYNWNRPGPGKKTDYNGSVAFNYLYRVTPRLQFTAAANAAYLSQPDFSRINTPQDTQGGGDYVTATAKLDLSYRWSPRFTTVLSATDNALFYQEKDQQNGDYNETIFGTELRYLWSPKLTLLLEGRFSQISYAEDTTRNATTSFLLVGAEARLSNRLSGSVRLGQALRSFDESGERAITPYGETSLLYRIGPLSTVNWTMRYGFEEPGSATEERQTFRTGLSYTQVFSPRLNGVASINYINQTISQTTTDQSSSDQIFDATLRLEYAITRRFQLNASYTLTDRSTEDGLGDFYRNRIFFGGEYTF